MLAEGAEPSPQAEAIAFLADTATHGGNRVTRFDTHAAVVFLAGEKAYKLKRAVRCPFLDYSTMELRRQMCEREVERNRLFAPDLYLGVLAITKAANGSIAFSGEGEPIDWVVEMRRFDDGARLDLVVERQGLDDPLAEALAHMMSDAHARSQVRDAGPWITDLARYIDQNDEAFRANESHFNYHRAGELTIAAMQTHARIFDLMHARGRQGKVRLGHGDAHLGNIALIDGSPLLFDAIEFDDTIATGDILYDLAFLLMDLWERGERKGANRIFNRYLELATEASDLDALAAMPFFLMMRAAIRAKVIAAAIPHKAPEEQEKAATAARRYFDWAGDFLQPATPRLVAIGGLSGTGKSTQARLVAHALGVTPGAVILRTDTIRKRLYGIAETENAPPEAYEPLAHGRVYEMLLEAADRALAAGHSVIADAVFAKEDERHEIEKVAKRVEVRFDGIWLQAPLDAKIARIEQRQSDVSDADAQVAALQETYETGAINWHTIDAAGPIPAVEAKIRKALGI